MSGVGRRGIFFGGWERERTTLVAWARLDATRATIAAIKCIFANFDFSNRKMWM